MKELLPQTEDDLADMIAGADGPLRVQGGGTRPIGRVAAGPVLRTSALSGIALYEPGALTIVARAGTPLAEVETALEAEGQRLAFEPMDHRGLLGTTGEPTVGGMVAANVSGPRRIQVGACRDSLLGVKFVDGRGQRISNGGRVMKNVTGYDLVKLMAGSYGTLGVLTKVALKVLPRPAVTGTLALRGLSDGDAVKALSVALGSPFEVTGAAHMQTGPDEAAQTLIRIEGSEASVTYRAGRLQDALCDFSGATFETDAVANGQTWCNIRDAAPFHGRDGAVWRISVKPGDAPGIVSALSGSEALYDWGGGLVWLFCPPASGLNGAAIREVIAQKGGHATLIRGDDAEAFHPLPEPLAGLQRGLRQKFDPRAVLNPGMMEPVA